MRKWMTCVWILMSAAVVYSQTVMTADKTKVVIGDQIKATITTNLAEGREWRNRDHIWPDSIPGIVVVSGPEVDEKNLASARYTWYLSVFDTGWVHIPSLPVVIRQGNQLDTFFTNDIPVQVMPVEPDSSGLVGIKDIVRQPFSLMYYKKYIPHLIVLLLIAAGAYYWWRKNQKKAEIPEPPIPEPPPHVWALDALDELERSSLWQKGEIKEHYTLLTAILREYLERRYGIRAMEQTSDEILEQLRLQNLDTELLTDTGQLLSVADLIKFAKADPGVNVHQAAIDRVRKFVKETMIIEPPELPGQSENKTDETVE